MELATTKLLSIGAFARVSGLTVKALRHYDERVDPETGYRYYRLGQARDAEAIRRLRSLEVPLDDVRTILAADGAAARDLLAAHRARLEGRAVETARIARELGRLIEGKESLVAETDVLCEMRIEEYPEQPVLGIRERVHQDDLKRVIPAAYKELFAYLREIGEEPVEPWAITVCPFADDDGIVAIENNVVTRSRVLGRGRIESHALPACTAIVLVHKGPYEQLPTAYRALQMWLDDHGVTPAGDPREIYLTDPEEVSDPADYVTEIAWPIPPEQAARARGRHEKSVRPLAAEPR